MTFKNTQNYGDSKNISGWLCFGAEGGDEQVKHKGF